MKITLLTTSQHLHCLHFPINPLNIATSCDEPLSSLSWQRLQDGRNNLQPQDIATFFHNEQHHPHCCKTASFLFGYFLNNLPRSPWCLPLQRNNTSFTYETLRTSFLFLYFSHPAGPDMTICGTWGHPNNLSWQSAPSPQRSDWFIMTDLMSDSSTCLLLMLPTNNTGINFTLSLRNIIPAFSFSHSAATALPWQSVRPYNSAAHFHRQLLLPHPGKAASLSYVYFLIRLHNCWWWCLPLHTNNTANTFTWPLLPFTQTVAHSCLLCFSLSAASSFTITTPWPHCYYLSWRMASSLFT